MSTALPTTSPIRRDYWSPAHWAIMPVLCRITLFLSVLGNGIDIARVADRSEGVSFSFQVVLRIVTTMLATGCGVWGWWRLAEVREICLSRRGVLAVALVLGAFCSVLTAPSPNVAFFVATALGVYALLTITCIVLRGVEATLFDAMLALWSYVVISWILRVLAPDLTTFEEYLSNADTLPRFGGLGHPNVLSAIQCLGMLLVWQFVKNGVLSYRWIFPAALLMAVTLLETKSRTPVIAFFAVLAVSALPLLKRPKAYLLLGGCVALGLVSMLFIEMTTGLDNAVESITLKFTKTGDVDELTSATGRTDIWGRATELILQSPLTGYGGGSSSQVMVEHSGHAHNLLLETALLFGIPVAVLFTLLLLTNVRDALRNETFFVRQFTVFLLVLGLVESPLFGLVPDPSMCIWFTCLFGPLKHSFNRVGNAPHTYV